MVQRCFHANELFQRKHPVFVPGAELLQFALGLQQGLCRLVKPSIFIFSNPILA